MNYRRTAALMVAMLVLGVVVGGVATGVAAPAADRGSSPIAATAGQGGLGLRLGGAMRDAGARLADIVAKLTGQDVDAVLEQRAAGESFASIAEEAGVTSDAVVDAAVDARKEILAERVEAGDITQEQADAAAGRMQTRLTDRVDSTDASCDGSGGGRGGRGRGGMGGGGMGRGAGAGCGGACSAQTPTVSQ